MKKASIYLLLAWNNIFKNKLFSVFCILASALTFIFINIILHISSLISGDNPPFSNADRIINVYDEYYDIEGKFLDGIPAEHIDIFMNKIRNYESHSILNIEYTAVLTKNKMFSSSIGFVNSEYFTINDFNFIDGRAFTKKEILNLEKTAVISEKIAKLYFNKESVIGEKLEVQGNTYTIIGVVENYSMFSTTKEVLNIWLPYTFNKFTPSGETVYSMDILFPKDLSKAEMKQDVVFVLKDFFRQQGREVDMSENNLMTVKEERLAKYGNNMLYVGVGLIILLLIVVPAINIITLSESSIKNRMTELAIRRVSGASRQSIFYLIITENLILVFIGFALGTLLTYPVVSLIEETLFTNAADGTYFTLLANNGFALKNIFIIILLGTIFSFISGGIPAYMAAKKNIFIMLKGGGND